MSKGAPPMLDGEIAARKTIELNPDSAQAYYNLGLLLAEDPARGVETEAAYRKAIELEPDNARYVYRLGLLLHENLGRFEEAKTEHQRAITLAPDAPFVYGGLISLLVQHFDRPEAMALSVKMRALLRAGDNWYGLAALDVVMGAVMGNHNAAIEHLRNAARGADFNREWARNDPDLASLRADPAFDEIAGIR